MLMSQYWGVSKDQKSELRYVTLTTSSYVLGEPPEEFSALHNSSTKSYFCPISAMYLQCKTRNGWENYAYGSIMLKIVLVAHLTYKNLW